MVLSQTTTIQPTPRISVLIDATNGQGKYLPRSLFALMTRSNLKRMNCEFLIMVDESDHENLETVNFFNKYMQSIEFLIGFAPTMMFAYKDPETIEYPFNILAAQSRGEWIFPLKASQLIETTQWDELFIERLEAGEVNSASIHFVEIPIKNANMGAPLFMVSRGYYDSLERIAPHHNAEDYVFVLMQNLAKTRGPAATVTTLDIVVSDATWGSIERSLPQDVDAQIESDIKVLTDRIKAGL